MRVLFIADRPPWPLIEGTRQRLFHLLKALTQTAEVTLLAPCHVSEMSVLDSGFPLADSCAEVIQIEGRPGDIQPPRGFQHVSHRLRRIWRLLSSSCPEIIRHWQLPRLRAALRRLKADGSFDLVWAARSFVAELAREAGFTRIVVDVDDIQTVYSRRHLKLTALGLLRPISVLELLKLYHFEQSLPGRYWRLAVCKEDDRRFFKKKDNVYVIPNGVDDFELAQPGPADGRDVLFLGTMGYPPNIDGVQFFVTTILPRLAKLCPGVRFHVAGKNPGQNIRQLHDGVRCFVHGYVADLTELFDRCGVVVAPMRFGSGTSLKVLESLARGKAVVATSTAIQGLDVSPGIHLEVADRPAQFASACARLLGDRQVRCELGMAGRKVVLDKYHWQAIGDRARRLVHDENTQRPVFNNGERTTAIR